MKKFFSFVLLFFVFFTSFIVFFPKEKLFYLLQSELKKYEVSVDVKDISSKPFSLELIGGSVYLSGAKVAEFDDIKLSLISLELKDIYVTGSFKDMVPPVKKATLYYKIGHFLDVNSAIGKAIGNLNLKDKNINITLTPDKTKVYKYSKLLKLLHKKGNKYVYKYNF